MEGKRGYYIITISRKAHKTSYPSVVVKNKEVHFCGNGAYNKWSRINSMEDAKRVGLDDIGKGWRQNNNRRLEAEDYLFMDS